MKFYKLFFLTVALPALISMSVSSANIAAPSEASKQGKIEKIQNRAAKRIGKVQRKSNERLEKIREKANKRLADIMARQWGEYIPEEVETPRFKDPLPPLRLDPEDAVPVDHEVPVDPVPLPSIDPTPIPEPLVPVEEDIIDDDEVEVTISEKQTVSFLGCNYDIDLNGSFSLAAFDNNSISRAWQAISADDNFATMAADMHQAATKANIYGWSALIFADELAAKVSADISTHRLIQAWLLTQLGYDVRLACSGNRLYLLFGTKDKLFNGHSRRFYYSTQNSINYVVYDDDYAGEGFMMHDPLGSGSPISLSIAKLPDATASSCRLRDMTAPDYSFDKITASVCDGLLQYYQDYPRFMPAGCSNEVTQYLNYVNAPLDQDLYSTLITPLKRNVEEMGELDAVNYILSFVQHSCPYKYDREMWGVEDRPFFVAESLYYPYSDCEDHAVLFVRLIREVLGIPCALVLYPNHLAAAVEFKSDVPGDYIIVDGHRMTIADPTIFYAPVGVSNSNCDKNNVVALRL